MLSLLSVVSEVVQFLAFPGHFKFFVNDTPLPSDVFYQALSLNPVAAVARRRFPRSGDRSYVEFQV